METERRNRIRLSLAAYAYEYHDDSIMSDAEFDKLSLAIKPEVKTGHKRLDKFFREEFDPSTGMWIRKHPMRNELAELYRYYTEELKEKENNS